MKKWSMGWNWVIQTFAKVYSTNVSIHELESVLESNYKFINPGTSTLQISLMYRNNDNYNSLIL